MNKKKIVFGICGSFCNHRNVLNELYWLHQEYDITFVISESVSASSTRFFERSAFRAELEKLSDHEIIDSIVESEKLGPMKAHDLMVIAPASANTVSKLSMGIYDTSVTLAAKAMLRNERPVLIGISTNDFIGESGANLLRLSAAKHVFLMPMMQDDPLHKPRSVTSCWHLMKESIEAAAQEKQLQPVFREAAS